MAVRDERRATMVFLDVWRREDKAKMLYESAPPDCVPAEINRCSPIAVELHEFKSDCAIIDSRLRIWRIRLGERTAVRGRGWKLTVCKHM